MKICHFRINDSVLGIVITDNNQSLVYDYIKYNMPCFVSEAARSLGLSHREVHYALAGLRKLGVPILGSSKGEYLTEDSQEIIDYCKRLKKRTELIYLDSKEVIKGLSQTANLQRPLRYKWWKFWA